MWDRWVSIESNQWFKHAKQGWLRSVTWDKHGVAMHLALLTLVTLLTVLQSYIILPKVFCHVPGLCCKPLVQSARPAGEDMLPGMGTSISLLQPWAISCTSLSGCWLLLITVGTLVPKHTVDVPTRLPWPSSWLMKWRRICLKIWICVCIILIHLASPVRYIHLRCLVFCPYSLDTVVCLRFAMQAALQHKLHDGPRYVGSPPS